MGAPSPAQIQTASTDQRAIKMRRTELAYLGLDEGMVLTDAETAPTRRQPTGRTSRLLT
jgi:hypothetical protein